MVLSLIVDKLNRTKIIPEGPSSVRTVKLKTHFHIHYTTSTTIPKTFVSPLSGSLMSYSDVLVSVEIFLVWTSEDIIQSDPKISETLSRR